MKTFIFTEEEVKRSKTYGWRQIECKIYRSKNNKPEFLGIVTYNTASTMGAISEVNKWLRDNKQVSKTATERDYYETNKKYQIFEL